MINTKEISIKEKKDFLELKEYIKPTHINDSTIKELSDNLLGICKKIIVETPYFDSDYLSSFYLHYAKKFKNYSKDCYRLILFSDENETSIIGVITLHPTHSKSHFGRIYLEPNEFLKNSCNILLTDCKIHIYGSEAQLMYFPELRQEGGLCVCGHVAIWSIVKYFSHWHRYAEKTSGEIAQAVPILDERKKFTSGIEPSQISNVFSQFGFAPLLRSTSTDYNIDELHEEMFAYINSGIPLVLIVNKFEHAVAAIGYDRYNIQKNTKENSYKYPLVENIKIADIDIEVSRYYNELTTICKLDKSKKVSLVDAYSFINSVIVNDDNFFPYKFVSKKPCSNTNDDYSLSDITGFIVPFYSGIQLDYNDVKIMINNIIIKAGTTLGWLTSNNFNQDHATIVRRMFIASSNKYREYLLQQQIKGYCPELCDFIRQLEFSKFLWVVELSTPDEFLDGKISGLALFDSTSSLNAVEQELLLCGNLTIKYFSDNEYNFIETKELIKSGKNIMLQRFDDNLRSFKKNN